MALSLMKRGIVLGLLAFTCAFAGGQELNVPKAYDTGVKAMDSGKYDEGLAAVNKVISQFGATGKEEYGPVFGHFYYLKGMLLIKQKKYKEAIESLQICYEKFPNDNSDGGRGLPNCFLAESLAQWGGCLMALEDYAGASEKYKAALAVTEQHEPQLNRLEAQVNLSKCMMLAGNSGRGKDFVSKNLDDPSVPPAMKRSFYLILMGDWSPGAPLDQVKTYLAKYKQLMDSDTLVNRYEKQNPVYNRLASEAVEVNDPERALLWYEQMIDPVEVGKAYQARIKQLENQINQARGKPGSDAFIAKTKGQIVELAKEISNQKRQLGEILLGKGSALYANGDFEKARNAYLELIQRFPNHPENPIIWHNLASCAVKLGKLDEAAKYGIEFFRKFPDHELRASMANTLSDSLFVEEKYEEAYRVCSKLTDTLSPGSPEAEVAEFVAAASLYHLTRFEDAESALSAFLQRYPNSNRAEAVGFYRGAAMVNLQKWEEAIAHFDAYLKNYKESPMRPSALYFSGLSLLVGGNYPLANSRIIELQTNHPEAVEMASSFNVLGDILSAREKPYDEITNCYQKALDMVEKQGRGNVDVAGYSIRQLIREATAAEKWEVAVRYHDLFANNYSGSAWRADVLTGSVPALVETGRKADAEKLLVDFVNEYGGQPNSAELDQMFATYLQFLRTHYPVEQVLRRIDSFPASPAPPPPALKAWLFLGKIETLAEDDPEKHAAEIKSTFSNLNAFYQQNSTSLSNYALVKLARHNRKQGGNEKQAREVYEYIVRERPGGDAMGYALIDLGKIEAAGGNGVAAGRLFNRVLNEVDDPAIHEEAVAGLARIAMAKQDHEEAAKWWKQYRTTPGWRQFRAEASYQFGVCLRELGKSDEAAAIFVNVYSNFPGHLDWSTKAYIDTARIIRAKGEELDALKLLREMIQRMGHLKHEGVDEGRKLFYDWREAYVAKQKK